MKVLTWACVLQTGMFVTICGHANFAATENQLPVGLNNAPENAVVVANDAALEQPQILILPHHEEFVEAAEAEAPSSTAQNQPLQVTASQTHMTATPVTAPALTAATVKQSVNAEIESLQQHEQIQPQRIAIDTAALGTSTTSNTVIIDAVADTSAVSSVTSLQSSASDVAAVVTPVTEPENLVVESQPTIEAAAEAIATVMESSEQVDGIQADLAQLQHAQLQQLSQTLDQSAATVVVQPLTKAEIKQEHELALKQRQAQATQPTIELNNQSLMQSQKPQNVYRAASRAGSTWIERAPLPANIGRVSSTYGTRVMGGRSEHHSGLDLAAPTGTPIYATGSGLVTKAGWGSGYGQYVEINHGNGYITRYGHASRLHVQVGERVNAGDHIANVGCTGRCTGPHLHYEVVKDGQRRNPSVYLALLP